VLAVIAVAGAIFGWFSMKRAQEAEAKAEQTRLMAEAARSEAEKLVVYLLDDFYLELAPVGRLDIVGELAKRALDYYNALPEALRTPQTERNRALALVRYGTVLRTQARLADGQKAIDEAVQVLGRMRAEGDQSETTAIGLAMGMSTQARLKSTVDNDAAALTISSGAVEAIRPLATAPNASVPARRTYGEVLNMHGFLLLRNEQREAAIAALDQARAAFSGIDNLAYTDLAAAAGYAEASSWQVQTYANLGRTDDAQRAGREAVAVAGNVLARRPGHMQALRAQALTTSPLAGLLADEMRLAEALAMVDATRRAWSEFVRIDSSNAISWSNLAVSHFIKGNIQEAMGRPGDAAATWRSTQALEAQAPVTLMMKNSLALHAYRLALLEAQRGKRREAEQALALGGSHNAWVAENAPPGSWDRLSRPAFRKVWPVAVADALGDHRAALELGRVAAPELERLKSAQKSSSREYAFARLILHNAMAASAYALGDFAAADREMAQVLAARKELGDTDLGDIRGAVAERTFAALAKLRLNRPDEARALIVPALKFQRELAKRNVDDPSQRLDLAAALYVAAVAGVGDPAAQLTEAAALMDKLPAEMKGLSYVEIWRARIADARAGRRLS
jgi:tetratricopeptide (TPR) repeat protein